MLGPNFRPWGTADWLLPKLKVAEWLVLGCVSTEDRCNGVLSHFPFNNGLAAAHFLEIEDEPSQYSAECRRLRDLQRDKFNNQTGNLGAVTMFPLMASPRLIKPFLDSALGIEGKNVVLDISSLPKRFFFPMLRLLSMSNEVENVVVTYTVPEKYADGHLAFEPQAWSYLPMFQREQAPPTLTNVRVIVSAGFLPFQLPELVEHDFENSQITLLVPFPPGPPQYQRNWKFIHEIFGHMWQGTEKRLIRRADATDVSGCFDHISSIAKEEPKAVLLAPFGPKPHSLAMCLYAMKYGCDVFHSQPKYYNPQYSTGIKESNGKALTHAYVIRLAGRDLY
jgi:hypothetical protein